MNVRFSRQQMALIKDALNNARQLVSIHNYSYHTVIKCVEGAKKRLDTLADIIDNGAVEDDT